jgi:hypothetical protein
LEPTAGQLQEIVDRVHKEAFEGRPLSEGQIKSMVLSAAREVLRGTYVHPVRKPSMVFPLDATHGQEVRDQVGKVVGHVRGARVDKLDKITRLTVSFDLAVDPKTGKYDHRLLEEAREEAEASAWDVDLELEFG